jgi:hypothetical protein
MKHIILVAIIILSFPLISCAEFSGSLNPGVFQPDKDLMAGKPYFASFFYNNLGDSPSAIEIHLECREQKGDVLCPDNDKWLKIQGPTSFVLKPGELKEIKIKIDIPRKANFKNNPYETLLIIQPVVSDPLPGQSVIVPSLAGTLSFKVSGKTAWYMGPVYSLQEMNKKLMASIGSATSGISKEVFVVVFGITIVGLLITSIYGRLSRRRRMRLCPAFSEYKNWPEERQVKFLSRKGSDVDFIVKESISEIENITNGITLAKEQLEVLPKKVRIAYLKTHMS